jgi:hypothetical protein
MFRIFMFLVIYAVERLQAERQIIGRKKFDEMCAQRIEAVTIEALDIGPQYSSVHPLEFAIDQWFVRLGEVVIHAARLSDYVKAQRPPTDSLPAPRRPRELTGVSFENSVDLVGHGFKQKLRELLSGPSACFGNE